MSYALVVWDGPVPLSNAHAVSEYERKAQSGGDGSPTPTAPVHGFLGRVFPDSIWADPTADDQGSDAEDGAADQTSGDGDLVDDGAGKLDGDADDLFPTNSGWVDRTERPGFQLDGTAAAAELNDEDTTDQAALTMGQRMLAGEIDGLPDQATMVLEGTRPAIWIDEPPALSTDGSLAILHARTDQVANAKRVITEQAGEAGLVAFDPQLGELLPSPAVAARTADFGLPSGAELPLHLAALLGESLDFWTGQAGVIEDIESKFYVQWLAESGNLTVEVQGEGMLPDDKRLMATGLDQMGSLGFVVDDPNWKLLWPGEEPDVALASEALARVLAEVRQIPVGAPMRLHTFPIPST